MAGQSHGKTPVSQITDAYWREMISDAAKKTNANSSDGRRVQFQKHLKTRLAPYDYTFLINAVFWDVNGYSSYTDPNIDTEEYETMRSVEYENYTFFASVIGRPA